MVETAVIKTSFWHVMHVRSIVWYVLVSSCNFPVQRAIPTIVSYNASALKINNATSSLVRFENKYIFSYFEKTL
jgi:hypothetical protein